MPRMSLAHTMNDLPLSVAAAAHAVGVAPSTLRTWDRRYGISPSARTVGAHRRYTSLDVARLQRMRLLINQGVSACDAAHIVLTEPIDALGVDYDVVHMAPEVLERAVVSEDRLTVRSLLDKSIAEQGLVRTWMDLIKPALAFTRHNRLPRRPGFCPVVFLQNCVLETISRVVDGACTQHRLRHDTRFQINEDRHNFDNYSDFSPVIATDKEDKSTPSDPFLEGTDGDSSLLFRPCGHVLIVSSHTYVVEANVLGAALNWENIDAQPLCSSICDQAILDYLHRICHNNSDHHNHTCPRHRGEASMGNNTISPLDAIIVIEDSCRVDTIQQLAKMGINIILAGEEVPVIHDSSILRLRTMSATVDEVVSMITLHCPHHH